jgi:hypothetical protein
MPQPSQVDVHVDAILTNISVAYIQKESAFVSSKVFPVVPVDKQSDKYFIYTKGDWFRDEAELRADATESAGSGYTLSTDNYYANVYALHKDIGDQVRENTDNPLDPDRDATQFITQRMLVRQETQWQADYFQPSIWGTTVTGGSGFTQWSDFAGSDPMEDIALGKETVLENTGFEPNTLVLGYPVFRKLKNHPDLVDRIKYTSSDVVTQELMAKYFEVDRIFVTRAVSNTALEGATPSMGFIFGKSAFLCYSNPSPSILQPSAGYVFTWKGVSDGLGQNIGITRFRMQHLRADRIEAQIAWTNKLVSTDLGYFFSSAVSSAS